MRMAGSKWMEFIVLINSTHFFVCEKSAIIISCSRNYNWIQLGLSKLRGDQNFIDSMYYSGILLLYSLPATTNYWFKLGSCGGGKETRYFITHGV